MKKFTVCFLILFAIGSRAVCQEETLRQKAHEALKLLQTVKPVPVVRNTNPDAQWFPDAGFGLFLHWGIHSVAAIDPSWTMIKNKPWGKDDTTYFDRNYYSLLWRFQHANSKWRLSSAELVWQRKRGQPLKKPFRCWAGPWLLKTV